MTTMTTAIEFELPEALAAREPPEARGLSRDSVKMMVSRVSENEIAHETFSSLPEILATGDVLVINTSATLNASFNAVRKARDETQSRVTVNLSMPLGGSRWVVELRRNSLKGTQPLLDAWSGEMLALTGGATATLVEPFGEIDPLTGGVRLWIAELSLPTDPVTYSEKHGSPVRYSYVPARWPLSYYQNVFADEPGSAEMPSAGRPFTLEILDRLKRKGVGIAPLILHTGVSSLDSHEDPYPERYRVGTATARSVNEARMRGGRVVAVGTTVVRALETVASQRGEVHAAEGWTDLVVSPERGLRAVDAMLTGFHAPLASHLSMLEAIAGRDHLSRAYNAAVSHEYSWHEFGDVHLILP